MEESWEEEKTRRDAEEKEREEQVSKEEKEKASLVASFFGGTAKPAASGGGKPAAVGRAANRAPAKVVERASFTPEGGADVQVILNATQYKFHGVVWVYWIFFFLRSCDVTPSCVSFHSLVFSGVPQCLLVFLGITCCIFPRLL